MYAWMSHNAMFGRVHMVTLDLHVQAFFFFPFSTAARRSAMTEYSSKYSDFIKFQGHLLSYERKTKTFVVLENDKVFRKSGNFHSQSGDVV